MALQALAVAEASLDVLDQRFFLWCKLMGSFGSTVGR